MKPKSTSILWVLVIFYALFAYPALAVDVPKPGKTDSRIRYVTYNKDDVVQLNGFIGHTITVFLGKGEEIISEPIFGNPNAWSLKVIEQESVPNAFIIKPINQKGQKANSSLQVQTNRHVYMFSLTLGGNEGIAAGPNANGMMYQVRFLYEDQNGQRKTPQAEVTQSRNMNYSAMGAEGDFPYEIWDDDRSTYLRFYQQQSSPAFFAVDATGSESMVATHTQSDGTTVLHGVWKQLRLRFSDKRVVCIFKDDPIKMLPSSGKRTLDPQVELKRK
jgi:type IV secretion system protein VirB9